MGWIRWTSSQFLGWLEVSGLKPRSQSSPIRRLLWCDKRCSSSAWLGSVCHKAGSGFWLVRTWFWHILPWRSCWWQIFCSNWGSSFCGRQRSFRPPARSQGKRLPRCWTPWLPDRCAHPRAHLHPLPLAVLWRSLPDCAPKILSEQPLWSGTSEWRRTKHPGSIR